MGLSNAHIPMAANLASILLPVPVPLFGDRIAAVVKASRLDNSENRRTLTGRERAGQRRHTTTS
jgi:hypothetical protein